MTDRDPSITPTTADALAALDEIEQRSREGLERVADRSASRRYRALRAHVDYYGADVYIASGHMSIVGAEMLDVFADQLRNGERA